MNMAEAHSRMAQCAGKNGVITAAQARATGVSNYLLDHMVAAGLIRRPYRGVLVLRSTGANHATALRAAAAAIGAGDRADRRP